MKSSFNKIFISLTFVLVFSNLSIAAQFKVIRVYDGNTIKVARSGYAIKVRLIAIDAPETSKRKYQPGQPYSQEAKKYLEGLVLNMTVSITGYDLDVYNRLLGVIYLNGTNINLEMIRAGLAEVYRGKTPKGFDLNPYWQAEKEAKGAMRGMWSLGDEYISPREWRKMQREN